MNKIINYSNRNSDTYNPYQLGQNISENNNDFFYNFKSKFKNKKLKKIVNVYQIDYINGRQSSGFGDYLRGSVSLSIICSVLNLEFGMNVKNHPIAEYIDVTNNTDDNISYEKVSRIALHCNFQKDFEELINHINNIDAEICYIFTIFAYKQHEILSKINLSSLQKPKLNVNKNIFPTNEFNNIIFEMLSRYNLTPKNYGIIHIRAGDDFLVDNKINKTYIGNLIQYVIKKLQIKIMSSKKYIIISDNLYVKSIIKQNFKNIIAIEPSGSIPVHLGVGKVDKYNVMLTMMDFFLLTMSAQVISFSRYGHGSGFSEWGSFLSNIPFEQYIYSDIKSNFNSLIIN